jgi:hypothetical protein
MAAGVARRNLQRPLQPWENFSPDQFPPHYRHRFWLVVGPSLPSEPRISRALRFVVVTGSRKRIASLCCF